MDNLKQALLTSLALQPINYTSSALVILLVNTSNIAVGLYSLSAMWTTLSFDTMHNLVLSHLMKGNAVLCNQSLNFTASIELCNG